MEAQDILNEWSRGHPIRPEMIPGLTKLVEISFKAGKQVGIEEVVEWVNRRQKLGYLSHCGFDLLWEDQCKAWGIKDEDE